MVKRHGPPSQAWRTFLRNHAPDIAAMDLFVAPTIGFDLLYAFVIVRLDRRDLVWISVTAHPTAEWIARQLTEAFPWNEAPHYLIRDQDHIYGTVVTRRLRTMGIRDKPIAPASPWQNGFAERLIGSIRRECLDHFVVFGEVHLCRILRAYVGAIDAVGGGVGPSLALLRRTSPLGNVDLSKPKSFYKRRTYASSAIQNRTEFAAINVIALRERGLTSLAFNCGLQQMKDVIIIKH
jgi:transposase InsO family protein